MLFSSGCGLLELVEGLFVSFDLSLASLELFGYHVFGCCNACLQLSNDVVCLVKQGILLDELLSLGTELVLEGQNAGAHAQRVLVLIFVNGFNPCSATG